MKPLIQLPQRLLTASALATVATTLLTGAGLAASTGRSPSLPLITKHSAGQNGNESQATRSLPQPRVR
jgi:hypothetical protein